MTKRHDMRFSRGVLVRLRHTLRYVLELQSSANAASNTFRWLSAHSLRSIPVLDFDIICGALPSVALNRATEAANQSAPKWADTPVVGPHTVRHLLKNTPEFCLPVGTAAELLERTQSLKKTLSKRARVFLQTLRDLQNKTAVSSIARQLRLEEFPDLIFAELSDYEREADDLTLLSTLLSRNTPYEHLVGNEPEKRNVQAFRATLTYLRNERRSRPHQNLFDAYNVACAVEMFNNPSTRGPDRRIPLFITDTERLSNWPLSPWLRREFDTLPDLSHNRLFLACYQGLIARNNGQVNIAQDEAGLLTRQLTEIADLVTVLLDEARSCSATKAIPEDEVTLSHLAEPRVLLLQHKFGRLAHSWSDILSPVLKTQEYDRVYYLNKSLRPHVMKLLASEGESRKDAIRAFAAGLTEFQNKHHAFWELLQEHANVRLSESFMPVGFGALVDFSFGPNDGSLLAEMARGFTRDYALNKWGPNWNRSVTAMAHLRIAAEAVLAAYRSDHGLIAIRWGHNLDLSQILHLGLSTVIALSKDSNVVPTLHCFGAYGMRKVAVSEGIGTLMKSHGELLNQTEYMEFHRSGATVVFADKEPIDNTEKQFGIVGLPANALTASRTLIAETLVESSFTPLSQAIAEFIVGNICGSLELSGSVR